jgi:hypothetical protein
MRSINKRLMRLASVISSRLAARHSCEPLLELPRNSWDQCNLLVRQIRRAQLRGWHLAARQLRIDLRYILGSLQSEVTALHSRLPVLIKPLTTTRPHDVYRDLVILVGEFDTVEHDHNFLSVVTESIELQGVYLGPFEIRLDLHSLASTDSSSYRVIATDPHPAESRDNVTHPHVMDQILCEGDGRQAIRQSLAEGRLLDFYSIVAGVLRNYNSESPFVELELWNGRVCSDCGTRMCEDDSYTCHRCGDTVCTDCEVLCKDCEDSCCSNCSANCPSCEGSYCATCFRRCSDCRQSFCPSCLNETERCPNCHEEEYQEGTADHTEEDITAIQSNRVGETTVHA